MTALLLLRIYIVIGAVYGLSVVAIAEATHSSEVTAVPLRRRAHVYLVALALGTLVCGPWDSCRTSGVNADP